MTISPTTFYDKALVELNARGFDVLNAQAEDWSKNFLQVLTDTFTNIWVVTVTLPGAGPNPPGSSPHSHLIVPSFFSPSAISTGITAACLAAGFNPLYAWESLRDAWASGLSTSLISVISDIQEGNDGSHTHRWLGISGAVLESAVVAYLAVTHPELDLSNPASKLRDYIAGISDAVADTILSDGETSLPIVTGITHTHTLT